MMFFTGLSRFSDEIEREKEKAIKEKTSELRETMQLVDEGEKVLVDRHGNLDEFGRLLDQAWKLKRGIGKKVSTDTLDEIYRVAKDNGALGGKLLGAGGGGFFAFYVPQERQECVKKALSKLLYIPFRFENSGSKVLYYHPEDYQVD